MDTVSIVGLVSIVLLFLVLGMIEWNRENFNQIGKNMIIPPQENHQLEWCSTDGDDVVCHYSNKTHKLKYGDTIHLKVLDNSIDDNFVVLGGIHSEEIGCNDQFILMNHNWHALMLTPTRKVIVAPFDTQFKYKLNAFDKNNVKGDVSSRIEPKIGINYLFFDDGKNAQYIIYENDEMVARDMYELFPQQRKVDRKSITFIDNEKCLLNNLVQFEFNV